MPKYIRVGNRVINLELLVNAEFVPKGSINNQPILILYFSNPEAGIQLFGDVAEQTWHLVSHAALNITPVENMKSEAIAP